jgi:VWFA-related protein
LIVLTDGVDRGSKESLNSAIEAAQRANTVVYSVYFKGEEVHAGYGGGPGNGGGMGRRGGGYPGGGGGWPGGGGRGGGGGQRPSQEPRVDGKKILEQMSGETGGRMYEITKKQSADQIYSSIAEELRTQYIFGYTPDEATSGPGYHKLTLATKNKDLYIQTRAGYYADR